MWACAKVARLPVLFIRPNRKSPTSRRWDISGKTAASAVSTRRPMRGKTWKRVLHGVVA